MDTTPFDELRDPHDRTHPRARRRIADKLARLREELSLAELRATTAHTQAEIAEAMGTAQPGISRIERQEDAMVSTLRDYIAATGGRLHLIAEYPHGDYEISLANAQPSVTHAFAVIWQNPTTRQFVRVGELAATATGGFVFTYTTDATLHEDFEPFASMPRLDRTYHARDLFPVFAERLAATAAPGHEELVEALGLSTSETTPVELLQRGAGTSEASETLQIVPEPSRDERGCLSRRFLVSGCRHVDEADPQAVTERIEALSPHTPLQLVDQPDNAANPRAIRLVAPSGPVGWIPDYLLDEVHKHRGAGQVEVIVDQANGPDLPWHLRLLARITYVPVGRAR